LRQVFGSRLGIFRVGNTIDCFREAGRWHSARDL